MGSMNSYLGVSVEAGIFPEASVSEMSFSEICKTDDDSGMGLSANSGFEVVFALENWS